MPRVRKQLKKQPTLGRPHNSKLGPAIFTWSLPAEETCPGATEACLGTCYALRGFFRMPNIQRTLLANYAFSQTDAFVDWMVAATWSHWVNILRIHVSGDFYDEAYVRRWYQIVQRTPRVRYFCYTRSWREYEMLPALRQLAALPNMTLWLSADTETGRPARMKHARGIAWMARSDEEALAVPSWATLIFRDRPRTLLKKVRGIQVCPHEIGLPAHKPRITCTRCKLCFTTKDSRNAEPVVRG